MATQHRTKVLILGSGPAGATAAIYVARAGLEPIMLSGMQPGGQLSITTHVENYPGFADPIMGPFLMQQMELQAQNVGTKIIYDHIKRVDFSERPFKCYGESGDEYISDTVIISTGAQARWLDVEGEKKYMGFGVSGCATCDGPFFKNKKIAVVGGGNSAVEEALYLTHHASEVLLIHRRHELRAEKIAQQRLFANPKIKVIWDNVVDEIKGSDEPRSVTSMLIRNLKTEQSEEISIDGVFVAIGHTPNSKLFSEFINLDEEGYILTPPVSTATNIAGIFAAGDVQDKIYRQAVTAAGTGCMAALEAEKFISFA